MAAAAVAFARVADRVGWRDRVEVAVDAGGQPGDQTRVGVGVAVQVGARHRPGVVAQAVVSVVVREQDAVGFRVGTAGGGGAGIVSVVLAVRLVGAPGVRATGNVIALACVDDAVRDCDAGVRVKLVRALHVALRGRARMCPNGAVVVAVRVAAEIDPRATFSVEDLVHEDVRARVAVRVGAAQRVALATVAAADDTVSAASPVPEGVQVRVDLDCAGANVRVPVDACVSEEVRPNVTVCGDCVWVTVNITVPACLDGAVHDCDGVGVGGIVQGTERRELDAQVRVTIML